MELNKVFLLYLTGKDIFQNKVTIKKVYCMDGKWNTLNQIN